jgi:hypothetical protein
MNRKQFNNLDATVLAYTEMFRYSNPEYLKEYKIVIDGKEYTLVVQFEDFLNFLNFNNCNEFNEYKMELMYDLHDNKCECSRCTKTEKIMEKTIGFQALDRMLEKVTHKNGTKIDNDIMGIVASRNKLLLTSLNQIRDGGSPETSISHYMFSILPGNKLKLSSVEFQTGLTKCDFSLNDAKLLRRLLADNKYVLKPAGLELTKNKIRVLKNSA